MDKKRSVGITVTGIVLIFFSVSLSFANHLGVSSNIADLIYLVILICGIGILMLAAWARIAIILLTLFLIGLLICMTILRVVAGHFPNMDASLSVLSIILPLSGMLFYLTRPKVKEQFKAATEKTRIDVDSGVTESKKRPGWVWVISIFFFFSAAYTLLSFYLINSGKIPLQPAQKAYFESLTSIDMGLTILLGLTNLIGAVLLFCLRKQAFYLFTIALAANLLMTVWHIFSKGFIAAMPSGSLIGMLIGWGMLVAICVYIKKLEKTGILS